MKAGLVANVAHVPDTWATWRVHPKQATDMTYGATAEYQRKVEEMILDAVATCEAYLPPAVLAGLKSHWLDWTRDITAYKRECRRLQRSGIRRRIYQLTQVFNGTAAARYHMVGRFLGRPRWPEQAAAEMRRWPESLGLGPMIVPAPTTGR
jgi:hypothetical protein